MNEVKTYNIDGLEDKINQEKTFIDFNNNKNIENKFKTLRNRIDGITNTISKESLSPESRDVILKKLINLSPKRTGTFLEVFNKQKNNLGNSVNQYHDALLQNDNKVEIKTSRVLITEKSGVPTNLYEQLIFEDRIFAPFSKILTGDYDCNIQQVKTEEFDQLNYCLFFQDVIVEFNISKNTIKNINLEGKFALFKNFVHKNGYDVELENIISEISMYGHEDKNNQPKISLEQRINKLKQLTSGKPELIDFLNKNDILFDIYNRSKLAYSDKQHKGNIGEGQFHINKDNIIYHLLNNFACSYSYADFITVLQGKLLNAKKSRKTSP